MDSNQIRRKILFAMFRLCILFYLCPVACSYMAHRTGMLPNKNPMPSQVQLEYGSTVCSYDSKTILERRLEQNIKASVGVLLCYTNDKQESFVLLGRERVGKCDGETWCELGGSVETGESFLEAAIRESKEESEGIYQLDPNDLLNNGVVCYSEHKKKDGCIREEVYILLKVNDFYPADVLCKAVNHQNKDTYREKDDFKWVSCDSLCKVEHNLCVLKDIDGNAYTFTIRKFFYDALKRDAFLVKLKSVM
ncbi:MAG: NUDIX hydrolase (plasmid) [Candidatus Cardinium sp.]|uniref:NUDIX hydrolase n=1 Tax=Cardinium endosymbiont of Dermatophagoides farinae TaxID=2597823 RepID=UPI001182EF4A|nr:NUDIX hydrolase [Cardinium endosymbiont of Dermatophagoides farinae]TSJ79803.1 NUDIX domain-containing protein [Cardinium endosymbiont of Dermatophagoides farinae]UWW97671.1 MAG: NUDIX hydrolase [Candidatus Cardinium sp.]